MYHDMNYITFHCKYGQMSIHRGCILHLGMPTHVQILINSSTKEVLLKPSSEYERDAFLVPDTIYERKAAFGINGQDFLDKIASLMNWRKGNAYRVDGLKMEGSVLFSLDKAQSLADWQEELVTADEEEIKGK
jgi:hypothetical protein